MDPAPNRSGRSRRLSTVRLTRLHNCIINEFKIFKNTPFIILNASFILDRNRYLQDRSRVHDERTTLPLSCQRGSVLRAGCHRPRGHYPTCASTACQNQSKMVENGSKVNRKSHWWRFVIRIPSSSSCSSSSRIGTADGTSNFTQDTSRIPPR